jgi:hypothetical protein
LRGHLALAAGVRQLLLGLFGSAMLGRRVLRGGLILSHGGPLPHYAAYQARLVVALTALGSSSGRRLHIRALGNNPDPVPVSKETP